MVAFILVIVGGLNWGLVGAVNFDLVAKIFGTASSLAKIVYILVGLSALLLVFTHWNECKKCENKTVTPGM